MALRLLIERKKSGRFMAHPRKTDQTSRLANLDRMPVALGCPPLLAAPVDELAPA